MSDEDIKHFQGVLMVQTYGMPQDQKAALVRMIVETFQNPDKWPLEDGQRMRLLRELYTLALRIQQTEEAIKAKKP